MFSLMVSQPHLWDFVLLQTYCPNLKYTAPVGISVFFFLNPGTKIYNTYFPSQTHKISYDLYKNVNQLSDLPGNT